jgi:hypothetical protein
MTYGSARSGGLAIVSVWLVLIERRVSQSVLGQRSCRDSTGRFEEGWMDEQVNGQVRSNGRGRGL